LRGEAWHRFLARYPALEPDLNECFLWGNLAGEDLQAPPISSRWRDYETKTPREMEFLRAKILEQPQNTGLKKRLATLDEQWQNRDVWLEKELRECLLDAASNSAKIAIQKAISLALRTRLRVVYGGELPANLELDNDWINAILLACEVEENRKWAVAILRNCARVLVDSSAANWREALEGNSKFLEALKEQGKNITPYLARNEMQIGEYTLWIESEPLQILQMGNRFDTCLSRGGINQHSAITNVIDANKKVVYARHHASIVGRQLLCVSEEFELLGYFVYSTFQYSSKERYALMLAFAEFASRFSEATGIPKADTGKVLSLCGASWYDDGEINWQELREEPPPPNKRRKGHKN
jgi:hypothetical protein